MINKKQTAEIKNSSYIIYADGRLFNTKTGKFKKFTKNKNGYMRTQLCINNKSINYTQHRLLAIYFIDNPNNKKQVNHINGVKHDNRLNNLEWVTQSENAKHSFANGLQKVTKPCKQVIDVSSLIIYESVTDAAKHNNICRSYLSNMLVGRVNNKTTLRYYERTTTQLNRIR